MKHYFVVGGTRPRVPLDGQTSPPMADAAHDITERGTYSFTRGKPEFIVCHSHENGRTQSFIYPEKSYWIPAFAGMTSICWGDEPPTYGYFPPSNV